MYTILGLAYLCPSCSFEQFHITGYVDQLWHLAWTAQPMTVFSELTLLAIGVDNWTPRGAMDEEDLGFWYGVIRSAWKELLIPKLRCYVLIPVAEIDTENCRYLSYLLLTHWMELDNCTVLIPVVSVRLLPVLKVEVRVHCGFASTSSIKAHDIWIVQVSAMDWRFSRVVCLGKGKNSFYGLRSIFRAISWPGCLPFQLWLCLQLFWCVLWAYFSWLCS